MSVNEKMTTIADTIRAYTDGTEKLGLDEMAQQVQTVYLSGVYDAAYRSGHADGHEAGKQDQYDAFWDAFQQNGERVDYRNGFAGEGWDSETFQPKYDIRPTVAEHMFSVFGKTGGNTSITQQLAKSGVTLDTSNCTNCRQMFYACRATEIPNIDLTKATSANSLFWDAMELRKAEITVAENTLPNYFGLFGCPKLEDLTVNGVLDKSLALDRSPLLTAASVQSVIDALKDLTGQTAQTLTFHANVGARMTDAQKAAVTAKNWTLVY